MKSVKPVKMEANVSVLEGLVSDGICQKDSKHRIRINPDAPEAKKIEEVKQARDLLELRKVQEQENQRFELARQDILKIVSAIHSPTRGTGWGPTITAGLTTMMRWSEAEAYIENILEQGFSPAEWAIVLFRSAPWAVAIAVAHDWSIKSPSEAVAFFSNLGWVEVAKELVVSETLKQEGVKIAKVLELETAVRSLGKIAVEAIGFLWTAVGHLRHENLLSLTDQGDAQLEGLLWERLADVLSVPEPDLRNTVREGLVGLGEKCPNARAMFNLPW